MQRKMKKHWFFAGFLLTLFAFSIALAFASNPSSSNYDLNGYTITPSGKTTSTNYTLLDVGIGESGAIGLVSAEYSGEAGFPRRVGNSPPDVNVNAPNGGECLTGPTTIDFNVQDKDNSKLFARIAYSSTAFAFQNDINTAIVLNDYAAITELNCSNPNWSKSRNCTYQWNVSGITDGNYYLDLNVWDVAKKAFALDSSDSAFIIDNTPPAIGITTPGNGSTVQDVLVQFSVNKGNGCNVSLSTIRVDINGVQSADFNYSQHCTFSQGSYSCSYYETSLYEGDFNLAVTSSDLAGHQGQTISIFHFTPIVSVVNIAPSGGFAKGIQQVSFRVRNTARNTLYASIYYSSWRGDKQNAIAATLNLNNHAQIPGLWCESPDWSILRNCTYQWNTASASDGNYFIDVSLVNAGNDTGSNSSAMPFVLDNTPPSASVTGVSSTWVYSNRVYLGCSDSGSGCKLTKWYYFNTVPECSLSKGAYNLYTNSSYIDIATDRNDYLCLWVEDLADWNARAVSPQLRVDTSVFVVSTIASETMSIATQDLNNECRMYIDKNITVECAFKSTIKVSSYEKDFNRVWPDSPDLVVSPPKNVRVLIQSELEGFYHKDYFLRFESEQRTITSLGDERAYPTVVIRRRILPLLTTDGQIEIGTLTIKVRQQ